ncbi:MAG TPA: bifunctional phosphopantothenoylcysteine decarboxylase/phosphopantothenate--cysteine ligase CoaBC [Solirubrobacteraceae bacterium]|nr:bifunctional phosphopantothenoylcysteine decarboxylase/phosphopantothenate--cysteine ligase CoaBC [Solirubrobacteraceae bacterium]
MARLLIGVSGGIAAYKAVETARLAIRAGHAVRVIQTERSTAFVGPATFEGITGAPVLTDEFEDDPLRGAYPGEAAPTETAPNRMPITHLAIVQRADAYLIAPASANTIARLAAGLADSLVVTAALAAGAPGGEESVPVLVAPAMNDRMYRHPATQANLARLAERGVTIVGPGTGELASHGEYGVGRMSEPTELLAAVEAALGARGAAHALGGLLGRRVLVTAGGTREPIDAVRYIGNRSSGRMGYALAARAAARGAQVTLVSANVVLPTPPGTSVIDVSSAAEMQAACESAFPDCDVLLMAAAVADFRPRDVADHKLKKTEGPPPVVELEPTADIITGLAARRRPGQIIVGFAAEHGDQALDYGRDKLARKGLDAVVVNDVSQDGIGFDATDNEVTVLTGNGRQKRLARAGKDRIADGILDLIEDLATGGEEDVRGAGTDRTARV